MASAAQSISPQGYDVIGDIHGHANALRRLLTKLDYSEIDGIFRHPTRKVIFVGDFVDRGPEQREVLRIARGMCDVEEASAVLGNHEFNSIAWSTPDGGGGFLRKHSEKNLGQHAEFLGQLGDGGPEYHDAIAWFRRLPVWLELPGLRVVHACWHEPSRLALAPYLDEMNCFTNDGFREALRPGSEAFMASEILLKGPEQRLPLGISFKDTPNNALNDVVARDPRFVGKFRGNLLRSSTIALAPRFLPWDDSALILGFQSVRCRSSKETCSVGKE